MRAPRLSACADTDEIEALDSHIGEVAKAVDAYLFALGDELKRSTTEPVDLMCFTHVLRDALDGNANYEIECAERAASMNVAA